MVNFTQPQLIADVLNQYENHLHFLYLIRAEND